MQIERPPGHARPVWHPRLHYDVLDVPLLEVKLVALFLIQVHMRDI